MKNLKINMDKWFDKQEEQWIAMSVKKQHQYILYFFMGYVLLTAVVIFKVWYDITKTDNGISIEHIQNPILKKKESATSLQDSLSIILKNKIHERK